MFNFHIAEVKILEPIFAIISYQYKKYLSKGMGLIFSFLIFVFSFTYYPDLIGLIWPTLLSRFSEIPLFVGTMTFINVSITVCYSGIMYLIYTNKIQFFQQFRSSKEAWPWQTDPQKWRALLKKSILNVILNTVIIAPILLLIDCHRSFNIKMKMEQVPDSKFTYFWQFCIFLLANQIWIYLMHALIHQPKFYWIHKMHHEYAIPISISGIYVHPVQFIISSTFSTCLGYKILMNFYPVHVFSIIIWLTFRMIEINDSHSGYNWPWSQSAVIPFSAPENYHYFHHRVNAGNYSGILYFLDSFFGTNAEYWKYQQKLSQKYGEVQVGKILYGKQA